MVLTFLLTFLLSCTCDAILVYRNAVIDEMHLQKIGKCLLAMHDKNRKLKLQLRNQTWHIQTRKACNEINENQLPKI